ncbi:MAG: hypothetical protein M3Z35_10485 [Nitrospirota bacterium]|nr:hypothetical protein [Nitrospirota bacterium]
MPQSLPDSAVGRGRWHFRTGFQILTWAAYGGLGSGLVGFVGCFAALWRGQRSAALLALVSLIVGLVVVGLFWHIKREAQRVPPIHDITTDTNDPPRFAAILPFKKGDLPVRDRSAAIPRGAR